MFFPTALHLLALSLSAAAVPTDAPPTFNVPPIGSILDYSSLDFQPLRDATSLNISSSDPAVSGSASLRRRQDIDFDLVDSTPDPTIAPNNYTDYNRQAAIASVIADVNSDPLIQKRDGPISKRAPSGFASIAIPASAAVNAPLNCNGEDTFMGSRLFTLTPFDETLCATACTAQNTYNLKHPPQSGSPKICRFYNTYVLLKDGASQGQYW
jgi:hypothetical protein